MGIYQDDPEMLPLPSSDSGESDDNDNDLNASDVDVLGEEYEDYSEEESDSLDSDNGGNDMDEVEEEEEESNYIVKSDGDTEYLLPLDDMNEQELESLLEELQCSVKGEHTTSTGPTGEHHRMYIATSTVAADLEDELLYHQSNSGVSSPRRERATTGSHRYSDKRTSQYSDATSLYPSLHVLEMTFYFCAFWMGAGYSLYMFYRTSQAWATYLPLSPTPGSRWGRHRDDSDLEWYVWPALLLPYLHYAVLHSIIATLTRRYAHKHLCLVYITCSVSVIYCVVGSVGLILCITVPSLMLTVLLTRNKQLLWVAWCFILLLFNVEPVTSTLEQFMNAIPEGDYKVSVMVAWIILRSISYSLETCDADPDNNLPISRQILTLFAYCLYLPFLFTGPYMPYVDFMTGLNAPYRPWSVGRVMETLLQFVRFSIWVIIANFLLYHFYAHAMHWSPQLVVRLNSWALAGFLYYLIVFFVIKYVVLYGMPGLFASIEGYEAPPPPKCVLIICRFSELWRKFDYGLYMFMTRHIYLPWVASSGRGYISKLQGTALVFTFVYVWHGVTPQVMLWSGINFLGILAEKSADDIAARPWYIRWEQSYLSSRMKRRYHALLSMCLLVPSVTALAIFLSSLDNASTIGYRVFVEGFPQVTVSVMFFMYCIAQISFEVHNWKVRRGDKAMKVK